jgi:hypothetical protein
MPQLLADAHAERTKHDQERKAAEDALLGGGPSSVSVAGPAGDDDCGTCSPADPAAGGTGGGADPTAAARGGEGPVIPAADDRDPQPPAAPGGGSPLMAAAGAGTAPVTSAVAPAPLLCTLQQPGDKEREVSCRQRAPDTLLRTVMVFVVVVAARQR